MITALMIWVGTMIFSFVLGTILCMKIEKSGFKRFHIRLPILQFGQVGNLEYLKEFKN